jgi:hypothetical protein
LTDIAVFQERGAAELPFSALAKSLARLHNRLTVLLGPDPYAAKGRSEALAKLGQLVPVPAVPGTAPGR